MLQVQTNSTIVVTIIIACNYFIVDIIIEKFAIINKENKDIVDIEN